MQLEFVNYVMLYHDVLTELYGPDKEEALKFIDDDFQFDAWLKRYSAKQREKTKGSGQAKQHVTKDTFLDRTKGMLPKPGQ